MRKNFAAGLIVLLPLLITYTIIAFLLKTIVGPFEKIIQALMNRISFLANEMAAEKQIAYYLSSFCIIIGVLASIALVGLVARWVIFRWFLHSADILIRKIPIVKKIYSVCKDVTEAMLSQTTASPKQAVLVPYPSENERSLGLITGEFENKTHPEKGEIFVSVLIPCTPNPTVGYLCTFPKESVTFLNITADDTLKYLISCGSSLPVKNASFG